MRQVVVIGGAVNSILTKWLKQLGITEYVHYTIEIDDISPLQLQEAANRLYNSISVTAMVISVGRMADRLLNMVYILHGSLPDTKVKDKKKIELAMNHCKNYLTLRRYYGIGPGSTVS